MKNKTAGPSPAVSCCSDVAELEDDVRRHFFLLAFHAHRFELALFGFVRFHDLGLDLGCRFFELGRG